MKCDPREWVGLGFVSTIENAPGEVLTGIEGISSVAAQIAWGLNRVKPEVMEDYLEDLSEWGLVPVGWAWCDAEDVDGARAEGLAHARIAGDLPIRRFIANMEEPYDAHGDVNHAKFHMPDAYCEAFLSILPDVAFAVTTTPRWASNHQALRDAGAVLMPQAFSLEVPSPPGPAAVAPICEFSMSWGWTLDRVRPLVQVYETNGKVPAAEPYLAESEEFGVGVVPYILEQALGGEGRALLTKLVPAIIRQPSAAPLPPTNGDFMQTIGSQHGITAFVDWLQQQEGVPTEHGPKYDPTKPGTWPWPERLERTLKILVEDHDSA